ncbi:MAG: hypothetical protein AB1714_16515 [Acidobacteriota bacterium]
MRAAPVLWLLAALALVRGALYLAIIPPWQGPDEPAHFEAQRLLAEYRRPTSLADSSPLLDRELIHSLFTYRTWSFLYRQPPAPLPGRFENLPQFGVGRTTGRFSLAYVLYAVAVAPWIDKPIVIQLYAMRAISVVIGMAVVLLTFAIARQAFPARPLVAWGAALFVLFLPQRGVTTASLYDGNLAELLTTSALYLTLKGMRQGFTAWRVTLLLLCCGAACITKATAFAVLPVPLIVLAGALRKKILDRRVRPWRLALGVSICALGVLLTVLLSQQLLAYLKGWAVTLFNQEWRQRVMLVISGERLEKALAGFSVACKTLFMSFWMYFSWLSLTLPSALYLILFVLTLLLIAGWFVCVRNTAAADRATARIVSLTAALPILFLLGLFVSSTTGNVLRQGRFLFVAISALAIVAAGGWLTLFPQRFERAALLFFTAGLVALDAFSLFNTAIPFFYLTPFN